MLANYMMSSYLFGKLVSVPAVGVQMANRRRGPSIAEQVHELMDALGVTNVEAAKGCSLALQCRVNTHTTYSQNCCQSVNRPFPCTFWKTHHVLIRTMSPRVSLMGSVHGGEFDRVSDEKRGLLCQLSLPSYSMKLR